MFQEKNYHFKENDNKPNIEQILKTLNENWVLELNFNLPERRSNTENIIQQLRKYNFDLLEDEYLDRPIDFIFQGKFRNEMQFHKIKKEIYISQ